MVYINKKHTYQTLRERYHWKEEGGRVPTMDASEFLFFDSAKEASNNVNTFLNLRFTKKRKPAVF